MSIGFNEVESTLKYDEKSMIALSKRKRKKYTII